MSATAEASAVTTDTDLAADPVVVPPEPGSAWPAASRFITVLLLFYVVKQVFSVAAYYPFSGHDELAHFSYVRTLATEARLPVLPDLEAWQAEFRLGVVPAFDAIPDELYPHCGNGRGIVFVLDWYCEPDDPQWKRKPPRAVTVPGLGNFPSGYIYVANHPPLYYVAMAPAFLASARLSPVGQHYVLRLLAIPFGLIAVYAAYRLARALFPGDAFLTVTVPAAIAFQPQISYEAALVNNDIVAIALVSLLLWGIVVGLRDRFPLRLCLALGLVLGLGLLTKSTTAIVAPAIGLAVVLAVGWRDWRGWLGRGIALAAPAAVLAAPWYLFLYRTYGDFSGLSRIRELQYWSGPMGSFFALLTDPQFVGGRFRETWGEFGWRLIHLNPVLEWVIAIPTIAAFVGMAVYAVAVWRGFPFTRGDAVAWPHPWQWQGLVMLLLVCLLAYLAVVQFGTEFALTQARYFFPAANAAALLAMLGLRTLIPGPARPAAQGVIVAALLLLNVMVFVAYVLPFTVAYDEPFAWTWGG
jgi:4-amino-4-deoxy-L-arabinose transferase-like glycosyltransferase